ncbi:MAG: TetR/AcrR family transcriptional regulator [Lachnospiraceae bacterium]|nr:TetR/AcrR family transcriptional regulator [Lachnospiraceae bacterium]
MRNRDYDKQQRIKEAMVRLILQEGIEKTSVAKIARDAGVSPATIYIYYSSKEEMLAEVFREYSRKSYHYLMDRIRPDMAGSELIDTIVRSFYAYTREHEEVFSFVEQCSRCPTLSDHVSDEECCCDIMDVIHMYQDRGIMKRYSDTNIGAVLFSPVRFLAMNSSCRRGNAPYLLDELISMLQDMLLN